MKKAILSIMAACVLSMPSVSEATSFDIEKIDQYQEMVMVDAPRLIELGADWYVGPMIGKDINGTTSNEGWMVGGKVSYFGTAISLPKLFGGKEK